MARYVLIEFANDAEAEEFVHIVESSEPKSLYVTGHIAGVFQKPTKFCKCTAEQRRGTIGARGSKYGWFICGKCRRPARNGNQTLYNLLENDGREPWERVMFLQVLSALRATRIKPKVTNR